MELWYNFLCGAVLLYSATKFFKLLINLLFGIQFDYINPLNLCVHNITYGHPQESDVYIKVSRIRLNFSFFLKLKSFIGVNVSGVNIRLKKLPIDKGNETQGASDEDESYGKYTDQINKHVFDPEKPVSIISDNPRLNRLRSFLIKCVPHLSFSITETSVDFFDDLSIIFEKIVGHLDINQSKQRVSFLDETSSVSHSLVFSVQIDKGNLFKPSKRQILSKFFDQCIIASQINVDLESGFISSLMPSVRMIGVDVSVLYVLKLVKFLNPSFEVTEGSSRTTGSPSFNQTRMKLYVYSFFYKLIKTGSFTIQSFTVTEIPVSTRSKLNNFLERQDSKSLEGMIFVSASMNSFIFDVSAVEPSQVGYSLKFFDDSFPLRWMASISDFKLSLDYSKFELYDGTQKQFDILSISNLLLTVESTMMVNLMRVVFNNEIQKNFTQKQTVSEIQFNMANFSIDLSVDQLIVLLCVLSDRAEETRSFTEPSEYHKSNTNEQAHTSGNIYKETFLETSPKFYFKFLFDKPTIILRSENEIKKNVDNHLLFLQPSMLLAHLDVVTIDKTMKISSRLDIPQTALVYQRNNSSISAATIAEMKDVFFRVNFLLPKVSSLKIFICLNHVLVDLTSIQALNGLGIMSNALRVSMHKYRSPKKHIQHPARYKKHNANKAFTNLPDWFSNFTVSIGVFKLVLGSKSLFIEPKDLLDENDRGNIKKDSKIITPSKTTYKMGQAEFKIFNNNNDFIGDDSASLTSSNSQRQYEDDDYYWTAKGVVGEIGVSTSIRNPLLDISLKRKVLSIPHTDMSLICSRKKVFLLKTSVESIMLDHDIASHFTIFSSFYLLRHTFKFHLSETMVNEKHEYQLLQTRKKEVKPKIGLLDLFNIQFYVREAQLKMMMPGDLHMRLDLFGLKCTFDGNTVTSENKLIQLSVKKKSDFPFFNRVSVIDNMKLNCVLPNEKGKLAKINIFNNNFKILIPSDFVVHSMFDSIILTVKLTKKFLFSIKHGVIHERDKIKSSGIETLPIMKIKSKNLAFNVEDDPFEVELGMIYQLGIIEQKQRLKKISIFDKVLENIRTNASKLCNDENSLRNFGIHLDKIHLLTSTSFSNVKNSVLESLLIDIYQDLHKLWVNFSSSWVRIINEFKVKRRHTMEENADFLTSNILQRLNVSDSFADNVVDSTDLPPLMGIFLNDTIITIKHPQFENDSNDVHNFLHRVGKGVPKSTDWDKIIPMRLSLQASEVRVHLRDFPLPMVYIPNMLDNSRWNESFILKGTLVIAEQMPKSDKEYWYDYMPMLPGLQSGEDMNHSYSWEAPKTICTVKAYYEINCAINSDDSTTVTWSTAYQAVLRHLSDIFDTFSKDSKDPSPKLGIWDKLRNIMHGYMIFRWTDDASEVVFNILNSYDPYDILGLSAGFSLIFKNKVKWAVNDPGREKERDYFIFKSRNVMFGVPNHLTTPLPCWCSNMKTFMVGVDESLLLTSFYGYYMNTEIYYDDSNENLKALYERTKTQKFETLNIVLDGDVELKLSMVFERKLPDGSRTTEFRPHYENVLTSPKWAQGQDFDSYSGFRSDFVHMALNLVTKNSKYNVLRVSPKTIFQFMTWFKRFSDDVALPIRNGSLWKSATQSVKLGSHLMTFKFMFDVEPLYIYHGYRFDLARPGEHTALGLKGKIGSFKCDLHQRKEKMIKHVDFLGENFNVMKMSFYVGKVELKNIDLRVIGINFTERKDVTPKHHFQIFDNDKDWIDLNDFEEVDLPTVKDSDIEGQVLPLLFASHFSYKMNKKLAKNLFGDENTHDCIINQEDGPEVSYNHICDVEKLKLKWYKNVRNIIFSYFTEMDFRAAYVNSSSFKDRSTILGKLKQTKTQQQEPQSTRSTDSKINYNIESKKEFNEMMRNIKEFSSKIIPVDDLLVRLNDVQVQLMIDSAHEHLMLFRTKRNEIEIVSLMDEDWFRSVQSKFIAKRIGTVFEDADVLILSKNDYPFTKTTKDNYGTNGSWPVFLDGSEPNEFVESKTLLSNVLIYFMFENPSSTYASGKSRKKLYLNIPVFETRIDSESYLKSVKIARSVLVYTSPRQKKFASLVQAYSLLNDSQDKLKLYTALDRVCGEIQSIMALHKAMSPARTVANREIEVESLLRARLSKLLTDSLLLSRAILEDLIPRSEEEDDQCFMEWCITAAKINVNFTIDDQSFLSFMLKDGSFNRLEMLDQTTINEVSIRSIQILNHDYNILYPELLSAFDPSSSVKANIPKTKAMLKIKWEIGDKIQGMPNIRNVQVSGLPMKLAMEDKTGIKLMEFLFPDENLYKTESNASEGEEGNDVFSYDSSDEGVLEFEGENDTSPDSELIEYKGVNDSLASHKGIPGTNSDPVNNVGADINEGKNLEHRTSKLSIVSRSKSAISSNYSCNLNRKIVNEKSSRSFSNIEQEKYLGAIKNSMDIEYTNGDILKMEKETKYFSIQNLTMEDFVLNISLYGKGMLRLINVTNLTLVVPKFVIQKEVWTSIDLIDAIKKHVIKTLLKQSGHLLKNKLFVYRRRKRVNKQKYVKVKTRN